MSKSSRTSEDVTVTDPVAYKCRFDNMQYCIPENERFRARSNMYCYPNICSIIKDHLSASDYEQLRRGCLGSILVQGVNMKTNFQLIHHMMLHEVKTKKLMEMWFKVNGLISRFSLLEFHVVTGLPCIKSHEDPPKDVSFAKFFGKPRCSYSELLECFKYERKSSPKKLIMAKLLLVEEVLLFRRSKAVSAVYLSLACDPEKFEKYPWGRESYELLLRSLKRASIVDRYDDRAVYEVYGYPLAFQAWIMEAFPCVARKFECTFKYVEEDPFSLHWVCDVKHTYDQAVMLFKGEMEPMFPNYGEFARKPGMEFEKEVADDIVDYISEPVFSQTQEDPIYDVRKLRKKVYSLRFGDNAAPVLQIGDVKAKDKAVSANVDDSDVFESPKRSMKHKNENLEVTFKKQQKRKVREPIVGRMGCSVGLKEAASVVVVKDKKSADNLGMKFKIRRNVRRNNAGRKTKGNAAEKGSGKIVANKEALSLTEGCMDASDMDVAEILALLPIEVRAHVPVMTTNEDKDEIECEERADKEASPENGDRDECEGRDVGEKEHPPYGVDSRFVEVQISQSSHEEMPEWAKNLSNRLDRLEEMPKWAKDLLNRLDRLEKFISANRDSIVTIADICAKINMLENRFTLYESMGATGQSSRPIPADPVSEKAVNEVLSSIKNDHPLISVPSSVKPDKEGGQREMSADDEIEDMEVEGHKVSSPSVKPANVDVQLELSTEDVIALMLAEEQEVKDSYSGHSAVDFGQDSDSLLEKNAVRLGQDSDSLTEKNDVGVLPPC